LLAEAVGIRSRTAKGGQGARRVDDKASVIKSDSDSDSDSGNSSASGDRSGDSGGGRLMGIEFEFLHKRTTGDVTSAQRDSQQQAQGDDAQSPVGFSSLAPVQRLSSLS
jgi:hypothetical protein